MTGKTANEDRVPRLTLSTYKHLLQAGECSKALQKWDGHSKRSHEEMHSQHSRYYTTGDKGNSKIHVHSVLACPGDGLSLGSAGALGGFQKRGSGGQSEAGSMPGD